MQIIYIYVLELYLSLFEVFKSVSESFNVCVFLSWEGCWKGCAEKKDSFDVKLLEYKTLIIPTQIMYI